MTGPEHYQAAQEGLLMAWEDGRTPESTQRILAEAQVRATLALAAAVALTQPIAGEQHTAGHPSEEHYQDWYDAIQGGGDRA